MAGNRAGFIYSDSATIHPVKTISTNVAEALVPANPRRIGLVLTILAAHVFIRYKAHDDDGSTKSGFMLLNGATWTMPVAVYTGAISITNIANDETPIVYATEY